jgi:NAD kinase
MGFMTTIKIDGFKDDIKNVLNEKYFIYQRSRLGSYIKRKNNDIETNYPLVLNEIVIDRGIEQFLTRLDLILDGEIITTIQADGNFFLL